MSGTSGSGRCWNLAARQADDIDLLEADIAEHGVRVEGRGGQQTLNQSLGEARQGRIALSQPNVQYEFADPKLESRSAGQKALIRMGSDNARAVKNKLRELRSELVARQSSKT